MDVGSLKSYGETTSEGVLSTRPAPVAGTLAVQLRLFVDFDNGAEYVGLTAPSAMSAGNTDYTLPDAYPTVDDQALVSTTAGVMSWKTLAATSFRQAFTDADLVAGVLTISHGLGVSFNQVAFYDNNNKYILPSTITDVDANTVTADLGTFQTTNGGAIPGTWNVIVSA